MTGRRLYPEAMQFAENTRFARRGARAPVVPRPEYPETREPFTWPTPGVLTWKSSAPGKYVYPGCSGGTDCACACSVGVYKVNGRVYGCGCHGHDARRAKLVD